MPSYLDRVDLPFYRRNLEEQLPERIIDIHCHVGRMEHVDRSLPLPAFWADRMCQAFSADAMMQTYRMLMPGKKVQPVWFAFPRRNVYLDAANSYAASAAHEYGTASLLVTRPTWTQDEVLQRAQAGGHRGLKPYFYLVENKPAADVTVFDCLPHHHLDLANKQGWIVVLHLPRSAPPGRPEQPCPGQGHLHDVPERQADHRARGPRLLPQLRAGRAARAETLRQAVLGLLGQLQSRGYGDALAAG